MDKQQVPPSYGLFLLGKKQKRQMQDSVSELSQSNASSKDYEPPGSNYRNPALANGEAAKAHGYQEAKHNTLLNEVRSQLSDLRDLLSSSKGSEIHEASVESSDLRITDEQLAHMAPGERALFLQRIPDLQNELFSEGVSSSISVGDAAGGTPFSKRFQPPVPTARQAVPTSITAASIKAAQADAPSLQSSKNGPPRVNRLQTGTPTQSQVGRGYISSTRTPAGSSFAVGDDSRRSATEQPRVVSIQRANLEVDNTTSIPHDVETSVESEFSASDITDVIEANVVLPPRLPQPAPAIGQRSTSSKRAKTPSEPRTVIQRVKPEIDDVVIPSIEPSAPHESEVDPDEYDAKLTVHRRPQSVGTGLSSGNRDSSYNSTYARSSLQAQKSNAPFDTHDRIDSSDHSDLNIPSSNATLLYTKQQRANKNTPTTLYNKNALNPAEQNYINESYDNGMAAELSRGAVVRSNMGKGTLSSNGQQSARTRSARQQGGADPGSFDDEDVISNVHAAASNFVKLPKQTKQALSKHEDSDPALADVMTIPESTVLYNPRQHSTVPGRYAVADPGDRSFTGRKPRSSLPGATEDDALYEHYDDAYEQTNVLSIQREPLQRSRLQRDVGKDVSNTSRHANASIAGSSGCYGEDISAEDDIQETKLFISAADAGRSRLVSDKSIGEKKHRRQHQGPNHTIVTQLAQYETKPREQMTLDEPDEEYSSSDPEVTISKLVYPKLTPAEQEKLRRLAEMRSKQPKVSVPDVHVYGRPKGNELELEVANSLSQKDNGPVIPSTGNTDSSHLYSNVTPYYQYKRQLAKNAPQGFAKAKGLKDSVSDDTPAQEVTQFVNSKYVEMARAAGMTDPSLLHGDVAKSYVKGTPLSSALHIRSDMTLGDIARSGRKFVVARKEEATPADISRVTATGRDGYTQKETSSDSEPQYEDMTILPAAEPYYGLPQPDFESFNHSIQSMRQSLLMRSSNTQSTSLTENQFDDRIARAKEAIRAAERQNGLSPSVLTTGSLSTNWAQAASPTTYMPQVISPAAHPRIRPTSRSHPPAPEPPLPDSLPEGGQVPQATIQRMNAMSDMVMPDRTASASSTSSGASGTLMQQLQKYGTIDPKIGLQSATGIPRSGKAQATPRMPGAASQNSRGSRPGQLQSSGRPGSMSGPRPSKRMYLQATTQDPDNVAEAVALAEYIIAQNRTSGCDSDCSFNMFAVLSDLQLSSNQRLENLKDTINTTTELNAAHDYKANSTLQIPLCQSPKGDILLRPSYEARLLEDSQLHCTAEYHLPSGAHNPEVIENLNATLDIIVQDCPVIHNAHHDLSPDCPSSIMGPAPDRTTSTMKLDLTLPSITMQQQIPSPENEETSFTSSNDADVEFAAPEYMLKPQLLNRAPPHALVTGTISLELDRLSCALKEYQPISRPLLLETHIKAIWNFSEDTTPEISIADSDNIIETRPAPEFFLTDTKTKHLQTIFVTSQPRRNNFVNLRRNRRSSLQYYKNAQLLLYGFIPDGSTGTSILQSHQQKTDITNPATSLLSPQLLPENKSTVYNCEQDPVEELTGQATSQDSVLESSPPKDSYHQLSNQLNNSPALCTHPDTTMSPRVQLGLSTSTSESAYASTVTTSPAMRNIFNSAPRPVIVESDEMDISLIETLKPLIEIEPQLTHTSRASKELALQHHIPNNPDTDVLSKGAYTVTTEILIPQAVDQSCCEDLVSKFSSGASSAVPAVPLYTTNPLATEATQYLYAHSLWHFPEDSVIFETSEQCATHEFTIKNDHINSEHVAKVSVEAELTLADVQHHLDSICLSVVPTAADPCLLFQPSTNTHNAEKEYTIKAIHRTSTEEVVAAVLVYNVNKTRTHDIRVTSKQRDLILTNNKNIIYLTKALNAEIVQRDYDQQCFEIDLPILQRTPHHAHIALDNLYSDVIAMHDVVVKAQPSKVKFLEANDGNYTMTRALSNIETIPTDFDVHELSRSRSAYAEVSRHYYAENIAKPSIDYLKKTDKLNIRGASLTRNYTHHSDYPNIRMTRLGNGDMLKLSDSIASVTTLHTQRSYMLKAADNLDEPHLEITVPKRAHYMSSTSFAEQYTQIKRTDPLGKPEKHVPNAPSHKEERAVPLYTLELQDASPEEAIAHTYLDGHQQPSKHDHAVPIYEDCISERSIEKSTIPKLETRLELSFGRQQPSDIPDSGPVDNIQTSLHAAQPATVISCGAVKPHTKKLPQELQELSSDAPTVNLHRWTGSTSNQPVNIHKSITSLTDASANHSYTSFLSIEGPSLPLRFDFSKPDYTISTGALDETLESTQSIKVHTIPKYTNFDTPSIIPSTLITNEMTFQTPETMAEGISTNLLLYPQQTLQLREPPAEPESKHTEESIKNTCISIPTESEIPQLYTQSNFYVKASPKPLDESVLAPECKKTDFVRSYVKVHPTYLDSVEDEDPVPLSIATRHSKQHTEKVPKNIKHTYKPAFSLPFGRLNTNSVPLSTSVSSSVSELLTNIDAAIALSKGNIVREGSSQNKLQDSTTVISDTTAEFSAVPEYGISKPLKQHQQQPIKLLPCATNYDHIVNPVEDVEKEQPVIESRDIKQSISTISSAAQTNITSTAEASTEPVAIEHTTNIALLPPFPHSYKATVINRAVETRGPYLLKKAMSEKATLAVEALYSIRGPPVHCSDESSSTSAHIIQEDPPFDPAPSSGSSSLQSDPEYTNVLLDSVHHSYQYQYAKHPPAKMHSSTTNYPGIVSGSSNSVYPPAHTSTSQKVSDMSSEETSAILQALQSLVDISKSNLLYVQAHNNSHKQAIDPLLWQEYVKQLEFLTTSIRLSSETILDLKVAFQTLNDKLIDNITSTIRSNLLTSDRAASGMTSSEKESTEASRHIISILEEHKPTFTVGTQVRVDPQPASSTTISRLEELQRLYKELSVSKDVIDRYAHIVNSPINSSSPTNLASAPTSVRDESFHSVNYTSEPGIQSLNSHKPVSVREPENVIDHFVGHKPASSTGLPAMIMPQSYEAPPRVPLTASNHHPLKPKKEICLPVISTSFIAKIKREAKRRKEVSEDALLRSPTLGPYLRQISYTENSIANHVTFAIFNDIMEAITVECVESIKKLMGL